MNNQPKPASSELVDLHSLVKINDELREQLATERKRANRLLSQQAKVIEDAAKLEQQLAAERERHVELVQENESLTKQLAAAGEALKQMPEVAYKAIIEGAGVSVENLPNELQCIADAALAKIGER